MTVKTAHRKYVGLINIGDTKEADPKVNCQPHNYKITLRLLVE
jgi:hypothetical protein